MKLCTLDAKRTENGGKSRGQATEYSVDVLRWISFSSRLTLESVTSN